MREPCLYGEPVERSWRRAITKVGAVQWEVIEPLDDGRVQHVAVADSNFDEAVAQVDRGNGVILSGKFGGGRVDDRPQPEETSR